MDSSTVEGSTLALSRNGRHRATKPESPTVISDGGAMEESSRYAPGSADARRGMKGTAAAKIIHAVRCRPLLPLLPSSPPPKLTPKRREKKKIMDSRLFAAKARTLYKSGEAKDERVTLEEAAGRTDMANETARTIVPPRSDR